MLTVGGCRVDELAAELRHAGVRVRRGAPPRPVPRGGRRVRRRRASTRRRRSCAGRWPGSPTTRGCCSTWPAAASCTSRWPPACRRRRARCTATTRASTSCGWRSTAGVRHIVVDSFDELDRLDALARRGRLPVPDVLLRDHAGRARPHPRVHRHRAGRLEVRLQPRQRRRRRGPSSGRADRRPSTWSGCTATSARTCSPRRASPRPPR